MTEYQAALDDLAGVFARLDEASVAAAVAELAAARRIALHGVGREGLQMRGLAMRLFHLGLDAAVVGDMTTPAIGAGDVLFVSAGPGDFATVRGLMEVARAAGARTMVVTARAVGDAARRADRVLVLPAQTMADDQAPTTTLPMGSLFEGAQFILFEVMVLRLRDHLHVTPGAMRARHTNLE